ncbi:hypothetical protein RP20_CCG011049 [Aedes albopictus]|nr:hypothetical protein RP20_CCG011049 [Aedes albopictus]
MENVSAFMTGAMAAMTAVTVPMNMTAPGNAMTVISLPVQMVHALPSRLNAMITKTAQMAAMNPIVVLAVRLTSSPALTVLVSTEINAVIDDEIVATVAMKPTVELIILLLMSNVAQADTNAQKVPVLIAPNSATESEIVTMDPMSTAARVDHRSSPVAMDNAFRTTWCATETQTVEINRMNEIVLAPGASSGVTPVSAFPIPDDVI